MGIALWVLCAVVVLAGSRMIAPARPQRFTGELLIAAVASLLGGLAATALDFGGWAELDWRAALFAICCGFAAVGCARAIGLVTRRVVQR